MKLLKRTRMEVGGLMLLAPLYGVLPFLIALPEDLPASKGLQVGSVLLCLALAAAVPFVRANMMGRIALPGLDDLRSFGAEPLEKEALELELQRVLHVYRQGTLTGVAMANVIGVVGLLLAVVQGSPIDAVPFAIVSFAGMGAQFPVNDGWRSLLSLGARASLGHPA